MSYKSTVLYDYPIAYYPLDDTNVGGIPDFTDILTQFNTYQDVLNYYSSYSNMAGTIAFDYSGCENDGQYIGSSDTGLLTLVAGNSMACKIGNLNSVSFNIENDYTSNQTSSKFGRLYSSDNDFSIECWFYPSFTTANVTNIVGDPLENVGIFYDKGNIVFKLDTEQLVWTAPSVKKSFYIVCTYAINSMSIYVDGQIVASKIISNFEFTNTNLTLSSGPTLNSQDYFLINSVGVYRYALEPSQILKHYQSGLPIPAIQVAFPEDGELFEIYDDDISTLYRFDYPANKSWESFLTSDLYFNPEENSIQIKKTDTAVSKTVVIEDLVAIPSTMTLDSSKIEWSGDNGITVETSLDGISYSSCINGQAVPGYSLNGFDAGRKIYLKITMSSTDASKYLPKLYNVTFSFYNNQIHYASNGVSYIKTLEGESGVTELRVTLGRLKRNILSRNSYNGLRTVQDSGFDIVTTKGVGTIEFFYTPTSLSTSGLISTTSVNGYGSSNMSWNSSGAVSKTDISAIYVNGVNKTSETNISNIFKANELHHVIVVFASQVSGDIRFNYSLSGSVSALYQNIALYETQFDSAKALSHYDLYRYKAYRIVYDDNSPSATLTENSVEYYNNDWLVIQSI